MEEYQRSAYGAWNILAGGGFWQEACQLEPLKHSIPVSLFFVSFQRQSLQLFCDVPHRQIMGVPFFL